MVLCFYLSESLESRDIILNSDIGIQQGESLPDTDNIVQLTRIFNVTADFLLNNELDIPIGSTTEDDKEILQSLLEKELKDDSDRLALKARNQKSESSIWIPIFTSGIMFLVIVMVYVFFFAS